MLNNNQDISGFNLGLYFCFLPTMADLTCGSVENPKVTTADSLVQLIQALAEQISRLRN